MNYEEVDTEEIINEAVEEQTADKQFAISEHEKKLLATQIDSDYQNAIADHNKRCEMNRLYYNLWRSRIGGAGGEEGKSNFKVPLTKWQLLGKLAKEVDALFGDDMQVVAIPVGPTDEAIVAKVGLWQTWRVKDDMKITLPAIEFLFNKLCYGRTFAYLPYDRETYQRGGEEIVWREGPKFIPLEPDDFIVPAERVKSLHQFSFVIRRFYVTPDELLDGEAKGDYFGITENWADIIRASRDSSAGSSDESQPVQSAKDVLENVNRTDAQSIGEFIEVLEYHGYWRMKKNPKEEDVALEDFDKRELRRTEITTCYLRHCNRLISFRKTEEDYPNFPKRRPFVESSLLKTGEYWSPGIPEMLMDIEIELSVNNNNTTEAGEVSAGPALAVRPTAAQKFKQLKWTPRMIIEVDDPERDAKLLNFNVNMEYSLAQEQKLRGYAELVTGLSDQALGRSPDRPNAPRTARGQILLDENANIRLGLDMTVLREDFKEILERIWMLDVEFAPSEMFFRVTEEQAKGLFDVHKGFGKMTAEERDGRFDFDIRFATSVYSREANKERELQLANISLATQIVAMNPQAQWHVLDNLYRAYGKTDFKSIVPKPPDPDISVEPQEEWARTLQGLDIRVNVLDQDVIHLEQHKQQLAEQMALPPERRDQDAINRMIAHIFEHQQQQQRKLEAAAKVAAQMTAANMLGLPMGESMPGQMPVPTAMPQVTAANASNNGLPPIGLNGGL